MLVQVRTHALDCGALAQEISTAAAEGRLMGATYALGRLLDAAGRCAEALEDEAEAANLPPQIVAKTLAPARQRVRA